MGVRKKKYPAGAGFPRRFAPLDASLTARPAHLWRLALRELWQSHGASRLWMPRSPLDLRAFCAWSCGSSGNPTALRASGCLAHRSTCAPSALGLAGALAIKPGSHPAPYPYQQKGRATQWAALPFSSLRGQDSNLRSPGYEPDEMPLLYPAL